MYQYSTRFVFTALALSFSSLLYAQDTTLYTRPMDEVVHFVFRRVCICSSEHINQYMSREQMDTLVSGCYVPIINELVLEKGWITKAVVERPELLDPLEKRVALLLGDSCVPIRRLLQRAELRTAEERHFIPKEPMQAEFTLSYPKGKQAGFRMWTHKDMQPNRPTPEVQMVIDIRWVLESRDKALEFHKTYLKENSESGSPYAKKDIKIKGAEELYIFNENETGAKVLKEIGVEQRHHYFLFVVDNTVAKVFVATHPKVSSKKAAKYAKLAATQLQKKP